MFGEIVVTSRTKRAPQTTVAAEPEATAGESRFRDILSTIPEEWVNATSLESLEQMISTCQKCPLGQTRTKFVFGVGNPNADIVVIGEAPGADEDRTGEPFVGLAGQLLNKILAAINLRREDVFIANILKSRPPGNRTPERFEVEQCMPYLLKQLELVRPKFILALGLTAANTLLGRKAKMGELRGTVHDYHGIRMVVTYHPAALLRNPQWKRPTWEDVQMLRRLYDESSAGA
jgi:DNA polymerase